MKQNYIILTNEKNKKLQEIKKHLRLKNINDTIGYLIEEFELKEVNEK